MTLEFEGELVPIPSPFTDDASSVSEVRLSRLIRWYQDRGVTGYVLNTDLGEFTSTSFSERKSIMEMVLRDSRGVGVVIPNVTTLNTGASLDLAQHAERHGARAVLLSPPYFGEYSHEEHVHHISMISKYCKLPILVVDGQQRLNDAAWNELALLPTVVRASGPNLHEWRCANAVCHPFAGLVEADSPDAEQLNVYFKDLGLARCFKSFLGEFGLELGSNRSPFLPPTQPQIEVIRALARMAGKEEAA